MKTHKQVQNAKSRSILLYIGIPLLIIGLTSMVFLCTVWIVDTVQNHTARTIIDPKAAEYIRQTYPDNDYVLDEAYYVFKDNCYRVKVHSPSSPDTHFDLDYDYISYALVRDGYKDCVLSGYNTRERLVSDYSGSVDACLSSISYISYVRSDLCQYSNSSSLTEYFSPKGLDTKTLTIDQTSDMCALGSAYGYLEVTAVLPDEEINLHTTIKILNEIDQLLAQKGIGYYVMEISLIDAPFPHTTASYYLYGVHPEDLHQENALAYLQELWESQEAHRQEAKRSQED